MAAVIISKKDVDRLGKEVLKEMYDFLHDEYILNEFQEMKEVKKEFLKNVILNHINTLYRELKITDEKRIELIENFISKKIKEMELKENAMKDGGIDTEGIYGTLIRLCKIKDEDLYFKTTAFLDIYRVFEFGYKYLE